jgi:hypothetical protein
LIALLVHIHREGMERKFETGLGRTGPLKKAPRSDATWHDFMKRCMIGFVYLHCERGGSGLLFFGTIP